MCLASKGSVEASFLALNQGWAINQSSGEGFCIYPDISFIVHYLRKVYKIKKIMIVDFDAHQGNGHERDHLDDRDVYIVDAYNHNIYPCDTTAKKAISCDLKITSTMGDYKFLEMID